MCNSDVSLEDRANNNYIIIIIIIIMAKSRRVR